MAPKSKQAKIQKLMKKKSPKDSHMHTNILSCLSGPNYVWIYILEPSPLPLGIQVTDKLSLVREKCFHVVKKKINMFCMLESYTRKNTWVPIKNNYEVYVLRGLVNRYQDEGVDTYIWVLYYDFPNYAQKGLFLKKEILLPN